MAVLACGLWAGMMGAKYASRASAGFCRSLRKAMYDNIQTFSFSNIDKFSTAGQFTSDNRCYQPANGIPDAFAYVYKSGEAICLMVLAFTINAELAVLSCGSYRTEHCLVLISKSRATQVFPRFFQKI